MNLNRAKRHRRSSLAARIVVISFLLIDTCVCAHAASRWPVSGYKYTPPTSAETSPMPPRYLAELAKIHEPPEMAEKPMRQRRPVPPAVGEISHVLSALHSPDKATHAQRATALRKLISLAHDHLPGGLSAMTYGSIAIIACFNGENPNTIINYATKAIEGNDSRSGDDVLALRARMYLADGNKSKALDDLQKLMVSNDGEALILDGEVAPQKKAIACDWSIPSVDALAGDPRGFAVKGLYLSSFLPFGYEEKDPKLEAQIRSLYARSERSWHSPIPYFLTAVTLNGLGSEEMTNGAMCIRGLPPLGESKACVMYYHNVMRDVRELTMALVIDPNFGPAVAARAEDYLDLAQNFYTDGKPSLRLFKLAIADFTEAITIPGTDKSALYNDRGLALASLGEYASAAASYVKGMELTRTGVEKYATVYEQLADVYMEMGRFDEAAHTLTDAIMDSNAGLIDVVDLAGLKAFRALYPQYEFVPDKIVAEDVRRRYEPQFPESWDSKFITSQAKCSSPDLADLYALRGDAYTKAGRRRAALADYSRLKSDAWANGPQRQYFVADGGRNYDMPTPWPATPPVH